LDRPASADGSSLDHGAENAAAALAISGRLAPGEMVVTREGHVFTVHSVGFHAADSEIHGLLARKQEIEQLEAELPALQEAFATTRARLAEAEAERHEQRGAIDRLREQLTELGARRHGIALDEVKASQALERARHRQAQIDGELAEIADDHAREVAVLQEALEALAGVEGEIEARDAAVTAAAERYRACDQALSRLREAVLRSEREAQEARFVVRSYENRIQELSNSLTGIAEQLARAQIQQEDAAAEATGYDDTSLTDRVARALEAKTERERLLAGARDALAEAERVLRGTEQERQLAEQRVEPMRERIGDLRLKEQEARLAEENFAQQLAEAQADEAALLASVDKMPRPGALQAEINRLNEEIAALGAVNLAALDELKTASERKAFLDAQSADLNEAMATLEDAIRRIDRETRERLQATFDEVNRNLAEMFPTLFGGGEAKLVMTGEEILDSGVQIIARPPGKKNASIHLLSGGEKALTAVSLVFSLFRLNPAPFCLLDEVDAPLDDTNTGRFSALVKKMSDQTQFIFISHNKITMEIADQLIGVTMPELGVSRIVAVDIEEALKMREEAA
ncbi:MAG: chromosome segregation protein SMC, partial [Burkholderiales bacterium]|nr:chromosome segregation protein SMC [Burkholderiales bacterium]